MSNEQKVAIITGASQGIGAGLVKAYRDNGFVVVANSRSIKPSSDEGVIAIAGNIGNRKVAAQVVNLAVERFGRIDTLINNVGIFISMPFTEYTEDEFQKVIDVNLAGFFSVRKVPQDSLPTVGA